MNAIEIYTANNGETQVEVTFENETVWLTLNQIAELFGRDKSVISRHLGNIYKEGELEITATVAKNATVQNEAGRNVKRIIEYYNLDVILSVGYRVNSKQGTQFRIWASQRLKAFLIDGYAINQDRLSELNRLIQIIENSNHQELEHIETKGLLDVLSSYTRSFILLNQFDNNTIDIGRLNEHITYEIQYEEAITAISQLKQELINRNEATVLFGNQKDDSFRGTLQNVVQTFDQHYLYTTVEEQAAHLLYFIIKNHPFSDGNKRIGAFIFVWFLEKNKHLVKKNGEIKINDNALTALALLVAQSDPNEKELMVKLICNLVRD